LIALLIDSLRSFGLTAEDFVIRLSSRNAWHDFYERGRGLYAPVPAETGITDSGGNPEYEFFQVIDKLERTPAEESEKKLAALAFRFAK